MKKTLVIALGVICAGASAVAWNATRATRTAKASLAAVTQQEVAAIAEIRLLEERAVAAEREEANLRSVHAGLPQPRAVDSTNPPSKVVASAVDAQALMKKVAEEREHASRPIGQLRELASQRKLTAITYLSLFNSLGLSPAQIERFIAIELKRFETSLDMKSAYGAGTRRSARGSDRRENKRQKPRRS